MAAGYWRSLFVCGHLPKAHFEQRTHRRPVDKTRLEIEEALFPHYERKGSGHPWIR